VHLIDGQLLAIVQKHILPIMRPGMDAPRLELAITHACAVRSFTVRAVIQQRVRSAADDAVALPMQKALT